MSKLVAFKITRGGRFNNPGFLTVKGFDKTIDHYIPNDFIKKKKIKKIKKLHESEYISENLKKGFKKSKVINNQDGTGEVNIDGDYETIYVKFLKDLNLKEISAIWDDKNNYDNELSLLNITDFEVLRKFKISSSDVFWSDDISDTCNAENNGIEEINEETYLESEYGFKYENINEKYYRKRENF